MPNVSQTNTDNAEDGGDACDENDDNDNWDDFYDNCQLVINDDDGRGDAFNGLPPGC